MSKSLNVGGPPSDDDNAIPSPYVKELPSYGTANELVEAHAGDMFRSLADNTFIQVGYIFGLDRYFKNESSMRNAVSRAYNTVLDNPNKYGVQTRDAELIQKIVSGRAIRKEPETLRDEREQGIDANNLLLASRDIAAKLMHKKLSYLDKHPKELKDVKIKDLAAVFATLYDKGQLAEGKATEHISVMSSIKSDMSPEDALRAVFTMREEVIATKGRN